MGLSQPWHINYRCVLCTVFVPCSQVLKAENTQVRALVRHRNTMFRPPTEAIPQERTEAAEMRALRERVRALEQQLASTATAAAPATTASASVDFPQGVLETDPTKSEQDTGDFKMKLRLRIAADPEAFFALADTTQDDSLSPEQWLRPAEAPWAMPTRPSVALSLTRWTWTRTRGCQGRSSSYAQRHPPVSQGRQMTGDAHRGAGLSCRCALERRGR